MSHASTADELYAFDITLHGIDGARTLPPGDPFRDAGGEWPTVLVPRQALAGTMAVGFDEALAKMGLLTRLYVEPDGSFVRTSVEAPNRWQVDGNVSELAGCVLAVDLKGSCPPAAFDEILAAFGWPGQRLVVQLTRPGVFLDEPTFRRHAAHRGAAGDGQTLRPG